MTSQPTLRRLENSERSRVANGIPGALADVYVATRLKRRPTPQPTPAPADAEVGMRAD
jgi:hypothetical protein